VKLPVAKSQIASLLQSGLSGLASLRLTCLVLVALIILSLAGAWIPQTDQTSLSEIQQRFGTDGLSLLQQTGLIDVFHSPLFLAAVAALFVNLIACTFTKMGPRIRKRLQGEDFLNTSEISQLRYVEKFYLPVSEIEAFESLREESEIRGYKTHRKNASLILCRGTIGWLAAPVTHLGLFVLLAGVLVTCLTSYGGTLYLTPGETVTFSSAARSRPITGSLPDWKINLVSTRKEDYPTGQPKQWFSRLRIENASGIKLNEDTVWVNHPLKFDGVYFYQSDWTIDSLTLVLAGEKYKITLNDMGGESMGVLPLLPDLLLIAAIGSPDDPVRLFLKHESSNQPRLFATLKPGEVHKMGKLKIAYDGVNLKTGLQFKYDPGQPVVYLAFALLLTGAIFVAIPSFRIWAEISQPDSALTSIAIGCSPTKLKGVLLKDFTQIVSCLKEPATKEVVRQ
jgi:cytochrome c biogenesis protein